jgi:hypothetical protein
MALPREQYQEYQLNHSARQSARRLGWISIGLGVLELCAPVPLARALGLPASTSVLLRLCGLRELATGTGLLLSDKPEPWVQARLAGDALDMVALGVTMHCGDRPLTAALAVMDMTCAKGLATEQELTTVYDYSDRSGFAQPAAQMRGVAAPGAPKELSPSS